MLPYDGGNFRTNTQTTKRSCCRWCSSEHRRQHDRVAVCCFSKLSNPHTSFLLLDAVSEHTHRWQHDRVLAGVRMNTDDNTIVLSTAFWRSYRTLTMFLLLEAILNKHIDDNTIVLSFVFERSTDDNTIVLSSAFLYRNCGTHTSFLMMDTFFEQTNRRHYDRVVVCVSKFPNTYELPYGGSISEQTQRRNTIQHDRVVACFFL